MFVFGPLDHNPANPVRVPGNIRVNLCFHSSLSVVQPKYRTRIGFVCTRRFPTLPADKSNGNSLSGRSVCSSNPTFCNGRIVLSSYQNNFGVGSNKCALRASNSFSNRLDSSNNSGLWNVNQRRCVCRTCATNRTYSAACSGVIFFQIFDLRAFRPVLVQLIHFSFCVSLRASFWPWRGWSFFGDVHAWVSGAIFPGSYSGRIRNRRCTKRTSRFPSCKSVRTTGNPGNQSLRSFRTDTGRIWS